MSFSITEATWFLEYLKLSGVIQGKVFLWVSNTRVDCFDVFMNKLPTLKLSCSKVFSKESSDLFKNLLLCSPVAFLWNKEHILSYYEPTGHY